MINIEQTRLLGAEYCFDFLKRDREMFTQVSPTDRPVHPPTFGEGDPMAIQDMSQTANSGTQRSWQEIAREVTQEQDPTKVRQLSAELNQAMLDEERRKVRLRFGY